MGYNPTYWKAYYAAHKDKLKKQHRAWYLKNKKYVVKKQVVYNRKARRIKRAARAGQKPVRKSVHHVSTADHDGPRDNPPISGAESVTVGEHGNAVSSLPQSDSLPPVEQIDSGYFDPTTGLVYKPISPALK